MKKNYGRGWAALLCLSAIALVGCSSPSDETTRQTVTTPNRVTPKITITTEQAQPERVTTSPADLDRVNLAPAGTEASCSSDNDCIPIPEPSSTCVPCLNSGAQRAVNMTTARQIMGPLKDQCEQVVSQLKQQMQQGGQGGQGGPQRSQDQSCSLNGAKCVEGICQLANLTEQEMQARRQAGQGGAQGGTPGGGQPSGGFGGVGAQGGGQPSGFGGQNPYGNAAQPNYPFPQGLGSRNNYLGNGFGNGYGSPNYLGNDAGSAFGSRNNYLGNGLRDGFGSRMNSAEDPFSRGFGQPGLNGRSPFNSPQGWGNRGGWGSQGNWNSPGFGAHGNSGHPQFPNMPQGYGPRTPYPGMGGAGMNING